MKRERNTSLYRYEALVCTRAEDSVSVCLFLPLFLFKLGSELGWWEFVEVVVGMSSEYNLSKH